MGREDKYNYQLLILIINYDMALLEQLRKDVFEAMKNKEQERLDILQIAVASIKNEELKKGEALIEDEEVKVLRTEVKKIKEAVEQYRGAGRNDLADHDQKQIDILESYLPNLMSDEEIEKIVRAKALETGAQSMRDMGKLMGVVMKEIGANADGNKVKEIVQKVLSE